MTEPNLAARYQTEEYRKNKKEKPLLYWTIFGLVVIIAAIVILTTS
ncbi:MAG: hypothetical protein WC480_04065 [Patescibacteria group bacterium]